MVFGTLLQRVWYFLLEAGFEKLALNFLQQTWFWTFLKVQRSLSSTLLQNDCSKKMDFLQGAEVVLKHLGKLATKFLPQTWF